VSPHIIEIQTNAKKFKSSTLEFKPTSRNLSLNQWNSNQYQECYFVSLELKPVLEVLYWVSVNQTNTKKFSQRSISIIKKKNQSNNHYVFKLIIKTKYVITKLWNNRYFYDHLLFWLLANLSKKPYFLYKLIIQSLWKSIFHGYLYHKHCKEG
jgi:hypothetical protein